MYKKLTKEGLEEFLSYMYTQRPINREIRIPMGFISMCLMNWTLETALDKTLPKYHVELYKRTPMIAQISVGLKHGLYKIVVALKLQEGTYRYSCRKGSTELFKANSLTSALRNLNSYVAAEITYNVTMQRLSKLLKEEIIKQRQIL